MSLPADINDRIVTATVRAEGASTILHQLTNLGEGEFIETEAGSLPSIAEWQRFHSEALGNLPALETRIDDVEGFNVSAQAVFDGQGMLSGLDTTGVVSAHLAIQVALNTRRVVRLPYGDFKISGPLYLNPRNVLVGTGMESTRLFRDTSVAPFDMINIVSKSDVSIRDIWFDSVQKETVTVAASRHCAIRAWDNGTGIQCERLKILGCRFDKFTSAETQPEGTRGVIGLERCYDVEVAGCQFGDNRATCVFWWNSDKIRVHDCNCLGEQAPYDPFGRLGSFTSGKANGVKVSDNEIEGTGYTSINVSGEGVTVSNNTIKRPNYSGITVSELLPASTDVTLSGNTIIDPGLDGISLFEVDGFTVTGNAISGASTASRGALYFHNSAAGNAPRNGTVVGNSLNGSTAGVRMQGGSDISLKANLIKGNSTGVVLSNRVTTPLKVFIDNNDFIDNTLYGVIAEGTATQPQVAYLKGNTFLSTDINTLQSTGVVSQSANSTIHLGDNTWSSNYVVAVETSFANRATKSYLRIDSGTFQRLKVSRGVPLTGTLSYDPVSLADGAGVSGTIAVSGVVLGDFVEVSFSQPLQGVLLTYWVDGANTVGFRFQNESGATVDLPAGTLTAVATKA